MWLEDKDESLVRVICSRSQSSADFCWVMGIIIDYSHTIKLSLVLETPVGTAKLVETGNNSFLCYVKLQHKCYSSQ